ncbi:MAG: phosphatidate cytidylyltransferase [Leptospiraceae bacterium]|nr:phosphatidate cytidylyltransferase [Leptospiraceae bacterium]
MGETTRRILSSAVLVPLFIFVINYTGLFFLQLYIFLLVGVYIGLSEFYAFSNRGEEGRPFTKTGHLFAFIILTIFYLNMLATQTKVVVPEQLANVSRYFSVYGEWILPIFLVLFIICYINQILTRPLEGAIFSTSATIAGVLYLVLPFGLFMKLVSLKAGIYYIWIVAGLTFLTDAGAYFGGRWFGRHPAGLKISPKKTWEGYVTGLITSVVYTVVVNQFWEQATGDKPILGFAELIPLTIILSFVSVAGDLAESAMKRDAKLKDSASVIPGHGGLLDLADAMMFTLPCFYFYLFIKQTLGYSI